MREREKKKMLCLILEDLCLEWFLLHSLVDKKLGRFMAAKNNSADEKQFHLNRLFHDRPMPAVEPFFPKRSRVG